MAGIAPVAGAALAQAGAVVAMGALASATRDELEQVTSMQASFGWLARKSGSGATKPVGETQDLPRTAAVPEKKPAAPIPTSSPSGSAAAPSAADKPPSPFAVFPGHRPSKLPGPPKSYDPKTAV
ncbi:hypothetical protein FVE85_3820 [Porphyridium purpureum]|uniref:Uncharacterized protein n=1 Tax=Porphyridium purpureum TaxID=35688 RepID=A0A5J4YGW0_PORPP|nr:hypothetical protein FVE85_3820 [Porphyridium purpureum]|eukprot:POR7484..scf243_20